MGVSFRALILLDRREIKNCGSLAAFNLAMAREYISIIYVHIYTYIYIYIHIHYDKAKLVVILFVI